MRDWLNTPQGLALKGRQKRLKVHEISERKQVGDAESMMNEESGHGRHGHSSDHAEL